MKISATVLKPKKLKLPIREKINIWTLRISFAGLPMFAALVS